MVRNSYGRSAMNLFDMICVVLLGLFTVGFAWLKLAEKLAPKDDI